MWKGDAKAEIGREGMAGDAWNSAKSASSSSMVDCGAARESTYAYGPDGGDDEECDDNVGDGTREESEGGKSGGAPSGKILLLVTNHRN
jgi:hypothetical protein